MPWENRTVEKTIYEDQTYYEYEKQGDKRLEQNETSMWWGYKEIKKTRKVPKKIKVTERVYVPTAEEKRQERLEQEKKREEELKRSKERQKIQEQLKIKLQSIKNSIENFQNNNFQELNSSISSIKKELKQFKKLMHFLKSNFKNNDLNLVELELKLSELKDLDTNLSRKINSLKTELVNLKSNKDDLQNQLNEFIGETSNYYEYKSEIKKLQMNLQNKHLVKLEENINQIEKIESEYKILSSEINKVKNSATQKLNLEKNQQRKQEIAKLSKVLSETIEEVNGIEKKLVDEIKLFEEDLLLAEKIKISNPELYNKMIEQEELIENNLKTSIEKRLTSQKLQEELKSNENCLSDEFLKSFENRLQNFKAFKEESEKTLRESLSVRIELREALENQQRIQKEEEQKNRWKKKDEEWIRQYNNSQRIKQQNSGSTDLNFPHNSYHVQQDLKEIGEQERSTLSKTIDLDLGIGFYHASERGKEKKSADLDLSISSFNHQKNLKIEKEGQKPSVTKSVDLDLASDFHPVEKEPTPTMSFRKLQFPQELAHKVKSDLLDQKQPEKLSSQPSVEVIESVEEDLFSFASPPTQEQSFILSLTSNGTNQATLDNHRKGTSSSSRPLGLFSNHQQQEQFEKEKKKKDKDKLEEQADCTFHLFSN